MALPYRQFQMPEYANPWGDAYGLQSFGYGTGEAPSLLGGEPPAPTPSLVAQSVDPTGQLKYRNGGNANIGAGIGSAPAASGNLSGALGGALDRVSGLLGGEGGSLGDLSGLGGFGGNPYEQAQAWDLAQKGLSLGGAVGASALAPFGMIAGEIGRQKANAAYSPYGDISLWEDVSSPDLIYGSPEDILSNLKSGQDVAIGGGALSTQDKQGLADYMNTKGVRTPEGNPVTPDDIDDFGQVRGSDVSNTLAAQQAEMMGIAPGTNVAQMQQPNVDAQIAGLLGALGLTPQGPAVDLRAQAEMQAAMKAEQDARDAAAAQQAAQQQAQARAAQQAAAQKALNDRMDREGNSGYGMGGRGMGTTGGGTRGVAGGGRGGYGSPF